MCKFNNYIEEYRNFEENRRREDVCVSRARVWSARNTIYEQTSIPWIILLIVGAAFLIACFSL